MHGYLFPSVHLDGQDQDRMACASTCNYDFDSVVRGHYIYNTAANKHDESAVGITKGVCIIGHIPREILRIFSFILRHGTIIRLLNLTTLVAGI